MIMSFACPSLWGNISQMKVVEDFGSRPHKAVSFVVERDKEVQEWNEQQMRRCLATVEAGCQEEAQKKEAEKKRRQRRNAERDKSGTKLFKKWLRASRKKARVQVVAKQTAQGTVGQSVKQNWACSQIENKEEEEDRSWNEEERREASCRQKSC